MKREERERDFERYLYPSRFEFKARENQGQESSENRREWRRRGGVPNGVEELEGIDQ